MKKTFLLCASLFISVSAFSQNETSTTPDNQPVVTSLQEGVAVATSDDETAVAVSEDETVEGVEEGTLGLSQQEAEQIVEDVEDAVSTSLGVDENNVKVGTPQVIRETVVEQTVVPVQPVPVEEVEEEVEEVYVGAQGSSIDDIINTYGNLTANMFTEKHFQSVWGRKGYFNISYNNAKLEPKESYKTGMGNNVVENMKCAWGVGIQYGRNYNLHKPIANIVTINLDYTPLDLNANYYKAEESTHLFNSSEQYTDKKDNSVMYLPWNTEKWEFNYGMNLGPSLTFAPFTHMKVKGLHFLKFNVYYHIGYHVSLLMFKPKENQDASAATWSSMDKASKLSFGHGLTNAVGFNVSWKAIGVGYEVRWASLEYMALDKENFGSDKYKFKAPTARVFLEIRL